MSFAFQRRRGTTSQHSSFTGLNAELTVDTDKKTVIVHDGSTVGGVPLAKERPTLNAQVGTTYTLAATDAAKVVTATNAGAITVTVPASIFVAGDIITVINSGAGLVTFAASGTTIVSTGATPAAPAIRAQHAAAQVVCTASNEFTIVGDIV
tara:strand:- start:71 stop:526 length:456 start_codon:yes stop_codon:yes gene_type:complete